MAPAESPPDSKDVLTKFAGFLARLMLKRPCFEYVARFQSIFFMMKSCGATFDMETTFVSRMALLPDTAESLEWHDLPYELCVSLRTSPLVGTS